MLASLLLQRFSKGPAEPAVTFEEWMQHCQSRLPLLLSSCSDKLEAKTESLPMKATCQQENHGSAPAAHVPVYKLVMAIIMCKFWSTSDLSLKLEKAYCYVPNNTRLPLVQEIE